MWCLTDRSSFVKVYRSIYAGWVRLTRSNARWGRTNHASVNDADMILDVRSIPAANTVDATIIVSHREKDTPVSVVADGSMQHSNANGEVRSDPFTVIDLNRYKKRDYSSVSSFTRAHAMINGAAVMSCTSTDGGQFVRDNMDTFKLEFNEQHFQVPRRPLQ